MICSPTAGIFPHWRGQRPLAADFIERFKARHEDVRNAWHDAYARLDRALSAQDPWLGYSYWGPEAASVTAGTSDQWLCGFLLWNIDRFDERFERLGLHDEFRLHFVDSFHRIFDQIDTDCSFVREQRDSYMKDLGIARGVLIPAVSRLIYPYSGLRIADTLKNGIGAASYVYARCGGRRPFFGLHVHRAMAKSYFNAEGWSECHRLVTMAYDAFPRVKGMLGISWFYDPSLDRVSPHLSYLRKGPQSRGARLLRIGEEAVHTGSAISSSRTRRAAYERGEYRPCVYALLWSKQDMLASVPARIGSADHRQTVLATD